MTWCCPRTSGRASPSGDTTEPPAADGQGLLQSGLRDFGQTAVVPAYRWSWPYSLGRPKASWYSPSVSIRRASSAHAHRQSPQMPAGASMPYSFSAHRGLTPPTSSTHSLGIVPHLLGPARAIPLQTTIPRQLAL